MKTALLHYWLTCMRGGEKVLAELCKLFPDADLYTHAAIPAELDPAITSHPIHESLIARLPFGRKLFRGYLPLMPLALRQWDLSGYDLIISSESGPVKGIRKPKNARHVCYCHTPMRYLWDMYDFYYQNAGVCGKAAMAVFRNYLRNYDLKSADSVDDFIANSKFVAERIKRIYHRESTVIHPPVNVDFFGGAPQRERTHYLFVGQLICYKRPDLAIKAFARLPEEKLIVVGEGPQKNILQKEATPNVSFVSCRDQAALRDLYASSKALLFPGIEDFGIVPVEAQAAGCPVIAAGIGGALETVIPGSTGLFFDPPAADSLLDAIKTSEQMRFSDQDCRANAARFSGEKFCEQMSRLLK